MIYADIEMQYMLQYSIKYILYRYCFSFFDNGSNYDYEFIMKGLAEEGQRQFEC